MRILIVEDDMTSRLLLKKMLEPFGTCDAVVNGKEAVDACHAAREAGAPYGLVCLDIMMPEMDGQTALKAIRAEEEAHALPPSKAAKIVMTTALRDLDNVTHAYRELCDGYLVKPILREKLVGMLKELDLLALSDDQMRS